MANAGKHLSSMTFISAKSAMQNLFATNVWSLAGTAGFAIANVCLRIKKLRTASNVGTV